MYILVTKYVDSGALQESYQLDHNNEFVCPVLWWLSVEMQSKQLDFFCALKAIILPSFFFVVVVSC